MYFFLIQLNNVVTVTIDVATSSVNCFVDDLFHQWYLLLTLDNSVEGENKIQIAGWRERERQRNKEKYCRKNVLTFVLVNMCDMDKKRERERKRDLGHHVNFAEVVK